MERKVLRFGRGFRVAVGTKRSQAAEMVNKPGHSGRRFWQSASAAGKGLAKVNGQNAIAAGRDTPYRARRRTRDPKHGARVAAHCKILRSPAYNLAGDRLSAAKL